MVANCKPEPPKARAYNGVQLSTYYCTIDVRSSNGIGAHLKGSLRLWIGFCCGVEDGTFMLVYQSKKQ